LPPTAKPQTVSPRHFPKTDILKHIEDEFKVIKVELQDSQSKLDQILSKLPA